ncbi:MAG: hypothetical protein FWE59_04255 [Oscillospiraceae bacterium]|nr:hypothetical protein [Oscillospiraceae bacterium]
MKAKTMLLIAVSLLLLMHLFGCQNYDVLSTEQLQTAIPDTNEDVAHLATDAGFYAKGNIMYYIVEKTRYSSPTTEHGFIYYYDVETGQSGPLCGKPECKHLPPEGDGEFDFFSETDCGAHFGLVSGQMSAKGPGLLFSDGEYLYAIGATLSNISVIRFSFDGTRKEKAADIGKYAFTDMEDAPINIQHAAIVRNAVLLVKHTFGSENGSDLEIYKCNLDGGQTEIIFSRQATSYERGPSGNFFQLDGNVIFTVSFFRVSSEDEQDWIADVYVWNDTNGQFAPLLRDIPSAIASCDVSGQIYYLDNKSHEMKRHSPTDDKTEPVVKVQSAEVGYLTPYVMDKYIIIEQIVTNAVEIYDVEKQKMIVSVKRTNQDGEDIRLSLVSIDEDRAVFSPGLTRTDGSDNERLCYTYCSFDELIKGEDIVWNDIVYTGVVDDWKQQTGI